VLLYSVHVYCCIISLYRMLHGALLLGKLSLRSVVTDMFLHSVTICRTYKYLVMDTFLVSFVCCNLSHVQPYIKHVILFHV